MPEKQTIKRARKAKRQGKSPSSQAGEFVREEMHHIRQGKHGARSTKQAIAIGLSKARRAGVKMPASKTSSRRVKKQAARDIAKGKSHAKPSARRSRAMTKRLKREGHSAASHAALSRQAKASARKRGHADLSRAARKAVRTKGPAARRQAAKKAARTRARHAR